MPDIEDGESVEMQGSAKDPYILRNIGGVYSCSCPAWRNQSVAIERRTCKHLRKYRGDAAEEERLGGELPTKATRSSSSSSSSKRKPAASVSSGADGEEVVVDATPGFLLAHPWDNFLDLSGWWMSEKLDGVRAYWDGKQFISRQGNIYMAPDWFIEDLPHDIHLDGELWIGRKAFQRTVSIVRRQDKSKEWEAVSYVVFDAPQVNDVFEARMAFLQQTLDEIQPRYARPHAQERCRDHDHLREELRRVEESGGEGLMLRQPKSKYEAGRSSTLLKVKTFHDAEARVIEHLPGTGKHKDRLGALSVEMSDGTKFAIGTGFSDKQRENPPPIGSIVTFRYQELTDRGVPRFPSFVRMRTDVDELPERPQTATTAPVAAAPEAPAVTAEMEVSTTGGGSSTAVKETVSAPAPKASTLDGDSESASSNVIPFPRGQSEDASDDEDEDNDDDGGGGVWAADDAAPRYFEFVEGSSSKFWTIWRDDNEVSVKYGKIGTDGQTKAKSFDTEEKAKKYYSDIIDEKTEKGYVEKTGPGGCSLDEYDPEAERATWESDDEEDDDDDSEGVFHGGSGDLDFVGTVTCYCSECTGDGNSSNGTATASGASAPAAKPAPIAVAPAPAPATKASTGTATSVKTSTEVRYFEFVEGKSSKFWSIWMDGDTVTVRYGRIGTAGQEKPKSFPTPAAAKKYYDDIIDEKVEKGYEEKDPD